MSYWLFYEWIHILVIQGPGSSFEGQNKCVFKASRKSKIQMFPPAPIIVAPKRYTYINSKLISPLFLQTHSGPCVLWKGSLKTHANGTIYDRKIISCKKKPRFILHKQYPRGDILKDFLQICNTFSVEQPLEDCFWINLSNYLFVSTYVGQIMDKLSECDPLWVQKTRANRIC